MRTPAVILLEELAHDMTQTPEVRAQAVFKLADLRELQVKKERRKAKERAKVKAADKNYGA